MVDMTKLAPLPGNATPTAANIAQPFYTSKTLRTLITGSVSALLAAAALKWKWLTPDLIAWALIAVNLGVNALAARFRWNADQPLALSGPSPTVALMPAAIAATPPTSKG
jgi:hypothetical protein